MIHTYFEQKIIEYSSELQNKVSNFDRLLYDLDRLKCKALLSDLKLILEWVHLTRRIA